MLFAGLVCLQLLAAAAPAADEGELRTVTIAVAAEPGQAVPQLAAEDVAVLENGSAREIARLERDERPLRVLLLVDSSLELGSALRLNLQEALGAFLAALPSGTSYSVWKTGERPTRLVDFTDDRAAGPAALRRVFPQGGNTMLDALVEATREVKREGSRSAVVAVSGTTTEFSSRTRFQVVEQALGAADAFYCLQIDEGAADNEMRLAYGHVFSELARLSGGKHETLLTSMAARRPLLAFATELSQRYRLTYATQAGLKTRALELQLARPGLRARVVDAPERRR